MVIHLAFFGLPLSLMSLLITLPEVMRSKHFSWVQTELSPPPIRSSLLDSTLISGYINSRVCHGNLNLY